MYLDKGFFMSLRLLQILSITFLIFTSVYTYADNQYDGAWLGIINCSDCSGCGGPITKSLSFEIEDGVLVVLNRNSTFGHKATGKINLKGGLFSSVGDISISGRYYVGNKLKSFSLRGKYAPQTIKISGTRGPRSCSGKLNRVESSVEREERQEKEYAEKKKKDEDLQRLLVEQKRKEKEVAKIAQQKKKLAIEQQKLALEKQRLAEESRKNEKAAKKVAEEKNQKRKETEQRKLENEKKRITAEKKRLTEEKRLGEERKRFEEDRRKFEEEKQQYLASLNTHNNEQKTPSSNVPALTSVANSSERITKNADTEATADEAATKAAAAKAAARVAVEKAATAKAAAERAAVVMAAAEKAAAELTAAKAAAEKAAAEMIAAEKAAAEQAAAEQAAAEMIAAEQAATNVKIQNNRSSPTNNFDLNSDKMKDLTSNKWSIGPLSCDLNGGAYTEYGEQYVVGERFTTAGKGIETSQKAWKKFIKNSDGTITLKSKIWAEGNKFMTDLTGSGDTIVYDGIKVFRVDGDKLYTKHTYRQIDIDALLNNRSIEYSSKEESSTANRCEVSTNIAKKSYTEKEIIRIEDELKGIPVSKYRKNLELYEKLLTLDQNSSKYKSKISFYKNKIEEASQKRNSYTAILSCGLSGDHINILACFENTELRITKNNRTKSYKIYEIRNVGREYRNGLHIDLPSHFKLKAQNSHDTLTLGLIIKNSNGDIVFEDQAGHYGVVSVSN